MQNVPHILPFLSLQCFPLAKQGSWEQGIGNVFPRQLTFSRHYKGSLDIKSMCEVKELCYSSLYRGDYSAERLNPKFLNGPLLKFLVLVQKTLNTKGRTVPILFGQTGKYSDNPEKNPPQNTSKTLDKSFAQGCMAKQQQGQRQSTFPWASSLVL